MFYTYNIFLMGLLFDLKAYRVICDLKKFSQGGKKKLSVFNQFAIEIRLKINSLMFLLSSFI